MAQRQTAIFADQIDDLALTHGLRKATDDTALEVKVIDIIDTDYGLEDIGNVIRVNIDDSFFEFSSDSGLVGAITLKDDSITEVKLDIFNSPTGGYFLQYDAVNGLQWTNVDTGFIADGDVVLNEIPSGAIGGNVTYGIAFAPINSTIQVFLNGLLQAPGTGKDYTLSGQTITFIKAPRANSELYVSYFKS